MDLNGKVAIVTGAGSGIGQATAKKLAVLGASVVVADVNEKGMEQTVYDIEQAGGTAVAVRTDVANEADVERMVQKAIDEFGGLDIAVNNAGIEGEIMPTAEYPVESWHKVIGINLTGVFLGMKHEIPKMLERGGGSIVNTSSILGHVAFANTPAYTASKHGVIGLTKTAALEVSAEGVRVNAVCPGFIETPMVMERGVHAGENREVYEQLVQLHPIGRLGKSEEIANAIAWLASDEASFVTGQSLTPDGGYIAR